MTAWSQIRTY